MEDINDVQVNAIKVEEVTPEDAAVCQAIYYEQLQQHEIAASDEQVETNVTHDVTKVKLEPDGELSTSDVNIKIKTKKRKNKNKNGITKIKEEKNPDMDNNKQHMPDDATSDTNNNMKTSNLKHPCTICSKQLSSAYRLRCHLQLHFGYEFDCNQCDKQFTEESKLKRHIIAKHSSEVRTSKWLQYRNILVCPLCKCTYKTAFRLAVHIRVKHRGHFACVICGEMFTNRESYINHTVEIENREICFLCDKSFVTKGSIVGHMRRRHKEVTEQQQLDN
jgi:hypothetical protein